MYQQIATVNSSNCTSPRDAQCVVQKCRARANFTGSSSEEQKPVKFSGQYKLEVNVKNFQFEISANQGHIITWIQQNSVNLGNNLLCEVSCFDRDRVFSKALPSFLWMFCWHSSSIPIHLRLIKVFLAVLKPGRKWFRPQGGVTDRKYVTLRLGYPVLCRWNIEIICLSPFKSYSNFSFWFEMSILRKIFWVFIGYDTKMSSAVTILSPKCASLGHTAPFEQLRQLIRFSTRREQEKNRQKKMKIITWNIKFRAFVGCLQMSDRYKFWHIARFCRHNKLSKFWSRSVFRVWC